MDDPGQEGSRNKEGEWESVSRWNLRWGPPPSSKPGAPPLPLCSQNCLQAADATSLDRTEVRKSHMRSHMCTHDPRLCPCWLERTRPSPGKCSAGIWMKGLGDPGVKPGHVQTPGPAHDVASLGCLTRGPRLSSGGRRKALSAGAAGCAQDTERFSCPRQTLKKVSAHSSDSRWGRAA